MSSHTHTHVDPSPAIHFPDLRVILNVNDGPMTATNPPTGRSWPLASVPRGSVQVIPHFLTWACKIAGLVVPGPCRNSNTLQRSSNNEPDIIQLDLGRSSRTETSGCNSQRLTPNSSRPGSQTVVLKGATRRTSPRVPKIVHNFRMRLHRALSLLISLKTHSGEFHSSTKS